MDNPTHAALVAAKTIAACDRPEKPCECVDHVSIWVGAKRWENRPVFSFSGKSKYKSLKAQCGERYAIRRSILELGKTAAAVVLNLFARKKFVT